MNSAAGNLASARTPPSWADVDTLLGAYLRCIDEAERVPAFNPNGYLRIVFQVWF